MNECGSCTACCWALEIPEINKPHFSECPNQTENGCKIYDNRPIECRYMYCLWKNDRLTKDKRLRPDKSGWMSILQNDEKGFLWVVIATKPARTGLDYYIEQFPPFIRGFRFQVMIPEKFPKGWCRKID